VVNYIHFFYFDPCQKSDCPERKNHAIFPDCNGFRGGDNALKSQCQKISDVAESGDIPATADISVPSEAVRFREGLARSLEKHGITHNPLIFQPPQNPLQSVFF